MKILIVEGVSTSGKSTISEKVATLCRNSNKSFEIVGEDLTLLPILHNRVSNTTNYILQLVKKSLNKKTDLLIFDRLHLTSSAVKNDDFENYSRVEHVLLKDAVLVLLTVDEEKLIDRVYGSVEHRGKWWVDHLNKKGTRENVSDHYLKSQQKLIDNFKKTNLIKFSYDATDNNFELIARDIYKKMF